MDQITENSYTELGPFNVKPWTRDLSRACKGGPRDKGEWLEWTELAVCHSALSRHQYMKKLQ